MRLYRRDARGRPRRRGPQRRRAANAGGGLDFRPSIEYFALRCYSYRVSSLSSESEREGFMASIQSRYAAVAISVAFLTAIQTSAQSAPCVSAADQGVIMYGIG